MFKLIIQDFYKNNIEMCLNFFANEIALNPLPRSNSL